jgi:hypothetical protein
LFVGQIARVRLAGGAIHSVAPPGRGALSCSRTGIYSNTFFRIASNSSSQFGGAAVAPLTRPSASFTTERPPSRQLKSTCRRDSTLRVVQVAAGTRSGADHRSRWRRGSVQVQHLGRLRRGRFATPLRPGHPSPCVEWHGNAHGSSLQFLNDAESSRRKRQLKRTKSSNHMIAAST